MIEAVAQAPIVALMVFSWLLVLCPAIFALLLFLALKRPWKGYAAVSFVVAIGILASVLWPRHFKTHGPALLESKIYVAATNLGLIVLFVIVLLVSLTIGLARQRSKGLSRGQIR